MKLKTSKNWINCHLPAWDNRSFFFNLSNNGSSLMRLSMYFQDIQTPRSQFKRRDKFGLTRIYPPTLNAKIAINKSQETTQYFFHTSLELKVIAYVTCTLWKIAWRGSRVINSNYHSRNMTPSYTSLQAAFFLQISGMLKFQLFASF